MQAMGSASMARAPFGALPERTATAEQSWLGFDGFFTCAIMLAALFATQLGSYIGVLLPGLVALFGYVRRERMPELVARTWLILSLGGFAIFSAVWSVLPSTTAYYGTQYLITLLGAVMIGSGCIPKQALHGLFIAMAMHSAATIVHGFSSGDLNLLHPYDFGYVGYAGSKNTNADMCCLGAFVGLTMSRSAWRDGNRLLSVMALGLVIFDVLIIRSCHSAGADAAGVIGAVSFLALSGLHALSRRGRNGLMIVVLVLALSAGTTRTYWFEPLFKSYAKSSGKDDTLSGRTYIWSRAEVQVRKRPLLGGGYTAFWVKGKLEPEAIWEKMLVASRIGFNFHNSVYDLLVSFGYFGLAFFSMVYVITISSLILNFLRREYHISILFVVIVIYELVRFSWEALPTGIFAHNTLYIYAALGHAGGVVHGASKSVGLPLESPGKMRGLIVRTRRVDVASP